MERTLTLLKCLADGAWHSGEELATLLEVSRTAVWKRLQDLDGLGLSMEAVKGRGYRLAQPLDLLDVDRIAAGLAPAQRRSLQRLEVLAVTDSTNQHLLGIEDSPALCFAEYQTAGRGRRGRQWISPFGANLCFSVSWRFDVTPAQLSGLSLAIGIGLADALAAQGITGVSLKWPNDLYAQGRKLGGILIEHRGEAEGPWRCIVGVGLNYAMTEAQGAAVEQDWISLAAHARAVNVTLPQRNAVAAACAQAVLQTLQQFATEGFASFHARWNRYDLAQRNAVRIEQGGRWFEGQACGVDADGALLVQIAGERRRFVSGELSLRLV